MAAAVDGEFLPQKCFRNTLFSILDMILTESPLQVKRHSRREGSWAGRCDGGAAERSRILTGIIEVWDCHTGYNWVNYLVRFSGGGSGPVVDRGRR